MTILSAAQSAGIRLLGRRPASLFSDDDAFGRELGDLAVEAAADIAEYYDWQKLKLLQTYTGDGSRMAFDLPSDFGRMLKDGEVHSGTWSGRPLRRARDENEWIFLQRVGATGWPGVWIILGGQMQIFPPMADGETASFYYIGANIVADNVLIDDQGNPLIEEHGFHLIASRNKATFTSEDDVFILSERLLTLSLIWRWRAQKRMEYSEDLTNYEVALEKAAGTDKGARVLVVGARRAGLRSADNVFPGQIIG